jgi:AraC-like DNA-binding protein
MMALHSDKNHADKIRRYVELLEEHAPVEGAFFSRMKNFGAMRMSEPHSLTREFYQPILLIVGQGEKNCYVGDQQYNYSAGQSLTLFLPMSVKTEIVDATPENPFLAAVLGIDLGRLAEVLMRIERVDGVSTKPVSSSPSGIFSAPVNDGLLDAFIRLLESTGSQRDASVLGELIVDEIYYRLLCDEQGGDLRTLLQQRGQIQRISKAVTHIHENVDKPVSVEELAGMVHMSRTTFHENFRSVMHVSPLQYAKSIKLTRAQTFIQEGKNASEAGYLVGYNSPAQFSREYKRHFGYAPSATVTAH